MKKLLVLGVASVLTASARYFCSHGGQATDTIMLKDEAGRVRLVLGELDKGMYGLRVFDPTGTAQFEVGTTADGDSHLMCGNGQSKRGSVMAKTTGKSAEVTMSSGGLVGMSLRSDDTGVSAVLHKSSGQPAVRVGATESKSESYVELFRDGDVPMVRIAASDDHGAEMKLRSDQYLASVICDASNSQMEFEAANGKSRVTLGIGKNGSGFEVSQDNVTILSLMRDLTAKSRVFLQSVSKKTSLRMSVDDKHAVVESTDSGGTHVIFPK